MITRPVLLALAVLLLAGPHARAATDAPGIDPTAIDPLLNVERRAIGAGNLSPLETYAACGLNELLIDPETADPARLTRFETARELARYFGGIPRLSDADRDALAWLAERPTLAATLLMAATDADRPERVLAVLDRLRIDHGERLTLYPDLAAALCVVWDDPPTRDADALDRASGLFHYYSRLSERGGARFDLREMPWPLLVYVVDNPLGEADIAYALRRYGGSAGGGSVYLDVPLKNRPGATPFGESERSLRALAAGGGAAADRAFYAAAVAKSLGQPAACAAGGAGGSRAWAVTLDPPAPGNRPAAWAAPCRAQGWPGTVTDPQTNRPLGEAEVAVLAEGLGASRADRLASWAMVKSAADAENVAGADAADALLGRAVGLCPGNRAAWEALADRAAAAPADRYAARCDAVLSAAARLGGGRYPEFALALSRRLAAGGAGVEQLRLWAAVARLLPASRADLQARVHLGRAAAYLSMRREDAALAEYGAALTARGADAPTVLAAADGIDGLLRARGEFRRLANIYAAVLPRLPKPCAGETDGPYLELASRRAAALDDSGDALQAAAARRQSRVYGVAR